MAYQSPENSNETLSVDDALSRTLNPDIDTAAQAEYDDLFMQEGQNDTLGEEGEQIDDLQNSDDLDLDGPEQTEEEELEAMLEGQREGEPEEPSEDTRAEGEPEADTHNTVTSNATHGANNATTSHTAATSSASKGHAAPSWAAQKPADANQEAADENAKKAQAAHEESEYYINCMAGCMIGVVVTGCIGMSLENNAAADTVSDTPQLETTQPLDDIPTTQPATPNVDAPQSPDGIDGASADVGTDPMQIILMVALGLFATAGIYCGVKAVVAEYQENRAQEALNKNIEAGAEQPYGSNTL